MTGLLQGLVSLDAPVVALCSSADERDIVADAVEGLDVDVWTPAAVRRRLEAGTWYLATQLLLHPIPLDPIPSVITRARLPVAALMYDVIPYRHPSEYLENPDPRNLARLRAPLARTVDLMLANSEFVRQSAAEELDYPIDRIRTVGVGVTSNFRPSMTYAAPWPDRVLPRHVERHVVAVTGTDDRKNTEGLLRAWGRLPASIRHDTTLVIATGHTPEIHRRWCRLAEELGVASEVIFTGHVSDDEMLALHQRAALAVFPSLDEGFGLPVIEAAASGCPVICSGTTALPEVLEEPAAYFDPADPESIAGAIETALEDPASREVLLRAGERAVRRWSWPRVAGDIVSALGELGPRWRQRTRPPSARYAVAGRYAVGVDIADAIAVANSALVDGLRLLGADVVELVDHGRSPTPVHATAERWPVRAMGRFVKPWDFDHVVAVLGGAQDHLATSAMARSTPCHLWIHEVALVGVRFGANLQALEIARSAIVASVEVAELVRDAATHDCPILVLPQSLDAGQAAAALASWLADVDDLDPSTIRRHEPAVASLDS